MMAYLNPETEFYKETTVMDKDFLLKVYGKCYDSEAGPWNLSLKNKYLEYMFAKFLYIKFMVNLDYLFRSSYMSV